MVSCSWISTSTLNKTIKVQGKNVSSDVTNDVFVRAHARRILIFSTYFSWPLRSVFLKSLIF